MAYLFTNKNIERAIHLVAQSGMRHSIENPHVYANIQSEGPPEHPSRLSPHKLQHLLYAPSISVYDLNGKTPFSTDNSVNYLVSLCTAPQKNE